MPAIRYFTVTETREIKVAAPDPTAAVYIASTAFQTGQAFNDESGRTTTEIKITAIEAREDY